MASSVIPVVSLGPTSFTFSVGCLLGCFPLVLFSVCSGSFLRSDCFLCDPVQSGILMLPQFKQEVH